MHRSLFGLQASHYAAENELRLTYHIEAPSSRSIPRTVVIDLIFVPNTRQLGSVQVEGLDDSDTDALVSAYLHANDVPGLVWAVVSRARRLAEESSSQ